MPYLHKKTLSNFRCSCHKLMIEKGRHLNIERDYRFCPYCLSRNVYIVEDEFHMLLICPLYDELRRECFAPQWLNTFESVNLFNAIMSSDQERHILALASFLHKAFSLREETVTL